MNKRHARHLCVAWTSLAAWFAASLAWADTPGEARFFAECPHRGYLELHDERRPADPHNLLYSALGLSEVEMFRAADWLVDTAVPGVSVQPFRSLTRGIRRGFHRLPRWQVIQRVGELTDALQLPELSLGDASAAHTVAAGGVTGPGSGMVVRVNKLIDWAQHVVGDLNGMIGRPVRRSEGLVRWATPGRAVDGTQWVLLKTFNAVSVLVAKAADHGVSGMEMIADQVVNLGYRTPHQDETVFLRLPKGAYRAHELWMLEHRPRLIIGTSEDFLRATHATLAHRQRPLPLRAWDVVDQLSAQEPIIVMTTTRAIAHAPASLKAYVVPAAWVLNEPGG